MEDAASHVSTGVGVVVSGSVAFEDGGAGRGNGRCPGVFSGEVGSGQTDRKAEETTAMGAEETRSRRWFF